MHIFLTGSLHTGKTTVLNKALSLMDADSDGFVTTFAPGKTRDDWTMYLLKAGNGSDVNGGHPAACRIDGGEPVVIKETFEILGSEIISQRGKSNCITVMDELGFLEKELPLFRQAVANRLLYDRPVLGVIRLGCQHWLDMIANLPHTEIITVTTANRDSLPVLIANKLTR